MTTTCKVDCPHCGQPEIASDDIVVIFNKDTEEWTYAFSHCNDRIVYNITEEWGERLCGLDCKLIVTSNPVLSKRPNITKPFEKADIKRMNWFVNAHGHNLAGLADLW